MSQEHVDFDVGAPLSFHGRSIRLVFRPDAEGYSLRFCAAGFDLRVHLDCSISPEDHAPNVEDVRMAAEGEVIFF